MACIRMEKIERIEAKDKVINISYLNSNQYLRINHNNRISSNKNKKYNTLDITIKRRYNKATKITETKNK